MKTTENQKLNVYSLLVSAVCGIVTGGFIFLFKYCASYVIRFSKWAYGLASSNPTYIPFLFLGLTLVACAIYFVLKAEPTIKGGGIPTAVSFIRKGTTFSWIKNALLIPVSALLTFLSGVPLGNEGPSVQIGCAIGQGTSKIMSRKNRDLDKYIMTSGACAGFGTATSAPLSAILFSIEEIHQKFSLKVLLPVIISTAFAYVTNLLSGYVFGVDTQLFGVNIDAILPLKFIWISIVVGVFSGLCSVGFYSLCKLYENIEKKALHKVKLFVRIEIVLLIVGAFGLFSQMYIGTGHDIAHHLLEGENAGILLMIFALIFRTIMLVVANKTGITGGLFVPSLALGALLGEIVAQLLMVWEIMPWEYAPLLVIMGMVSFLGVRSKMPLVAICFSLEALSGIKNTIPIAVCVLSAYAVSLILKSKKAKEND